MLLVLPPKGGIVFDVQNKYAEISNIQSRSNYFGHFGLV